MIALDIIGTIAILVAVAAAYFLCKAAAVKAPRPTPSVPAPGAQQ
jgi:hypothetical protein